MCLISYKCRIISRGGLRVYMHFMFMSRGNKAALIYGIVDVCNMPSTKNVKCVMQKMYVGNVRLMVIAVDLCIIMSSCPYIFCIRSRNILYLSFKYLSVLFYNFGIHLLIEYNIYVQCNVKRITASIYSYTENNYIYVEVYIMNVLELTVN